MLNRARYTCGLTLILSFAMAVTPPLSVRAQESTAASAPAVAGMGVMIETTARVVHIEPATNTVTLRDPRGNLVDVDVDPQLGDVRRLAVGDTVHIAYRKALLLTVEKANTSGIRSRVETRAVIPASGGTAAAANHIVVVATVQKIDADRREITLRGPKRTVTVEVGPDVPLEKLHVGDSIRADYVTATAVHITRGSAAAQ
jgi:Cu/Ag efflux protein CusF